ncbi:helix-turn-helix transcriptional regulator [Rathayibacter sp. VKM Ac-2928]|uniref:helix-turn-helix transcriptional regulator n=1 Tax=Rathayibacter sp. VKM Ac-2928 TaxID=2929479 RepID=UPI001FB33B6D|nr:helix-turn-helix transcriptional regulator [Rathayibacter sp. VKM Ac-2928]MCJ1682332.1 helix-turn-helix domain-containing protein [Rathayibacter sp. VKM Ac-2928]
MQAGENFNAMVDQSVARNVKRARDRAGLSQADVARLMTEAGVAGVHQTTIARIEGEQRTLRLAEALVLARILEYRVEDLVESTETARLHDSRRSLEDAVHQVRNSVRELLQRRQAVAAELDRDYPWSASGEHFTGEYLRVNPSEYDLLDELLSLNSDPSSIVADAYENLRPLLAAMATPFVASRSLELLEEAISNSWRGVEVVDRTEASDLEFRAAIARFG